MKKKFVGICVVGAMFLINGCGAGPDMSRVKPGDEVYTCGVYTVILHRDSKTVHGVKETGYRDNTGFLTYKSTRKRVKGTIEFGAWGHYDRYYLNTDDTFTYKVGNKYERWSFRKQSNGNYFLAFSPYPKVTQGLAGDWCERIK